MIRRHGAGNRDYEPGERSRDMAFIETRFEIRYCCEFCQEPVGLCKRTYLVNFDEEAPFAASLEEEFETERATDGDSIVDCSCQKREQVGSYTLLTSLNVPGQTTVTLFNTNSGYSPAKATVAVKKTARNSFRVVDETVQPAQKFGPVYRSRAAAEKRAAEEVEGFKTWFRKLAGISEAALAKDAE